MTPAELRRTATRCADALQLIYDHRRRHSPTTEWKRRAGEFDAWFIDQADELPAAMLALLDRIEGLERNAERLLDANGAHAEGHMEALKMYDAAKEELDAMKACECEGAGHVPWCRVGKADEHAKIKARLAAVTAARDEACRIAIDLLNGIGVGVSASESIRELKRVGQ